MLLWALFCFVLFLMEILLQIWLLCFILFIYVPQNLNWAFQILYLGLESYRQEGLVLTFCKRLSSILHVCTSMICRREKEAQDKHKVGQRGVKIRTVKMEIVE